MAESPGASTRKADITQLMKELKLRPFLGKDNPLCHAFLEDFRKQKNIEHVEPLIRTDDYDSPMLKPYRNRCPDTPLNEHLVFSARTSDQVSRLEVAEQRRHARDVYYGTRSFRLYEIDIDNDSRNGKEIVFYDQAAQSQNEGKIDHPQSGFYTVWNLKRCRNEATVSVGKAYESMSWSVNEHDVVQYRGKYYIYAFDAADSGHGLLVLSGYARAPNGEQQMGSICAYNSLR